MSWLPGGGDRHPSGGEQLDRLGHNAVSLAFRVLDRFPDVVKRHKYMAGGAAISGSLIALAGVAVAKRMRRGESADEAVAGVTEEELAGLRLVSDRQVTVEEAGAEDAADEAVAEPAEESPAAEVPENADGEATEEPTEESRSETGG